MNPNLNHAQSVPFSGNGNPRGIIDANAFPHVLDAVDLLVATGATYAGDDALARRVLSGAGPDRLDRQIQPDGSTP